MNNRKIEIERQFSRSASGSYDRNSLVQRNMAERLIASLDEWTRDKQLKKINILEIGCGTGTLTEMLVQQCPYASITAIDLAPGMIQAAKERISSNNIDHSESSIGHSSRINFLLEDVELWAAQAPSSSFDLIVSNACFQWLSDPRQTLYHLGRLLRPGGGLSFATFGPDTFHELHTAFNDAYLAIGMEPQRHGLSFQSAEQWERNLIETEFSSIQYEQLCCEQEYSSVRDFLLSVKAQGASASEATFHSQSVLRQLFANMYKAYESRYRTPDGVSATYELLFFQAVSAK